MNDSNSTSTATGSGIEHIFDGGQPRPGILVASAPPRAISADRMMLKAPFVIGRGAQCDLCIVNKMVSKSHARIERDGDAYWLEDLGSKNGVHVQGTRLQQRRRLKDQDVIRIGEALLVFTQDISSVIKHQPRPDAEFAGRFYSAPILNDLKVAAISKQHLLIAGPTGVGKELLVKHLVALLSAEGPKRPFIVQNMARSISESEAVSSLFGVGPRVFTGVEARMGLIEQANGGVLFLDEAHSLPKSVQRSLLRIIEDGVLTRIGESKERNVDVRFMFTSNAQPPSYGLAHDLWPRLYLVQVPSLKQRVADIPFLFDHLMKGQLLSLGLDCEPVMNLFGVGHYERMCLHGFPNENVRGMLDLTVRLAANIAAGSGASESISRRFAERFNVGVGSSEKREEERSTSAGEPSTRYRRNRDVIIECFSECRGNISATVKKLQERGISCSRYRLTMWLDEWGVSRRRNMKHD